MQILMVIEWEWHPLKMEFILNEKIILWILKDQQENLIRRWSVMGKFINIREENTCFIVVIISGWMELVGLNMRGMYEKRKIKCKYIGLWSDWG